MIVRPERAADHDAIDLLDDAALGRSDEAVLVRRLRAERLVIPSIVAEDAGHVVGHLLLSRLPTTVDGRSVPAAALAPMAVAPERRRRVIGGRMIESGIAATRPGRRRDHRTRPSRVLFPIRLRRGRRASPRQPVRR
ncbi:MAG: GNAT family N-acetyltransferase [Alphaproteobacteria bacterium]